MMVIRLHLFFAAFLYNTGFSAEISVFVQTGDSVQLDIQTYDHLQEFDELVWINNKSDNIVKYINASQRVRFHVSYKARVDFNIKSFSLTLKNMQKSDSGLYRARISGDSSLDVGKHRVSVMDAVEAPVLTVNSGWYSSDPCNLTCKGNNYIIKSIYNSSSCSQENWTSGINTLSLYCIGDFIICNYSNPVSWKIETKEVKLCTINNGSYPSGNTSKGSAFLSWLIPPICMLTLGLFVVSFYFCKKNKGGQQGDKVYAEVEENNKPHKPQEMLKRSENPQTVYDTAGKQPSVTMETNQTTPIPDSVNENTPVTENSRPESLATIYCVVQQDPKPKGDTDADHTIYAVVNKPTTGYESEC